ncbi:PH domain [Geosmithia morbida]|uniref:PH domain n=1 Tax=Geosmithia morbida TaxID=1094350 RepID=A0A9P4YT41_9HYPO|nr:PH domain [Geosmithia morbida]KAF4121166.1 PH domain [Geosmithia morbida]
MDPRNDPSLLPHGPPTRQGPPPPADARRAISMDQDYRSIMTARPRRSEPPPPYRSDDPRYRGPRPTRAEPSTSAPSRTDAPGAPTTSSPADPSAAPEPLPGYSSSIDLEGIFMKKHEIEDTTRRAEDRRWHATYVTLTGTALNLYKAKKNRTWGRTPQDGPKISPDNPPWMRKGKLEKSYSLLYADAGIAADYKNTRRRYVIRVRAETDQFLLSCIELSTFNQWLEAFFAAIDLALPIDDRDFPRDMSIPRVQRVRWYRLPSPARQPEAPSASQQDGNGNGDDDDNDATPDAAPDAEQDATPGRRTLRRRSSVPAPLPSLYEHDELSRVAPDADEDGPRRGRQAALAIEGEEEDDDDDADDDQAVDEHPPAADDERSPPRLDPSRRLSSSSYHNDGVDPHSGKWVPEHRWSSAHDLLYAKLCYSNLLFRSPRKSNFIIRQGKKWFVDWSTGRMVRVLPPAYGEVEFFGPWQVVHTENMRI